MPNRSGSRRTSNHSQNSYRETTNFALTTVQFILLFLTMMAVLYGVDPTGGLLKSALMSVVGAIIGLIASNKLKLGGVLSTILFAVVCIGSLYFAFHQYGQADCKSYAVDRADLEKKEVLVVVADFVRVDDEVNDPAVNLFAVLNQAADGINSSGQNHPVRVERMSAPEITNKEDAKNLTTCLNASLVVFGEAQLNDIRYVTYQKLGEEPQYDSVIASGDNLSEYVQKGGEGQFILNAILGQLYFADGLTNQAVAYLDSAINWANSNPPVEKITLGTVYAIRGYVENDPNLKIQYNTWSLDNFANPIAYNNRGAVYYKQGNLAAALADYNMAIQLDPNYAAPHNNLGLVYYSEGKANDAIEEYSKGISLNPDNSIFFHNRGMAYLILNNLLAAMDDFSVAISLDPNYAQPYYGAGRVLYEQQNLQSALNNLNMAINLDPNFSLAYLFRGKTYYRQGNWDMALVDFNTALQLDPNNKVIYGNRAATYFKMGRIQDAFADSNFVLTYLEPNCAFCYYQRGYFYEKLGNQAAAQADYEYAKSLGLDPSSIPEIP